MCVNLAQVRFAAEKGIHLDDVNMYVFVDIITNEWYKHSKNDIINGRIPSKISNGFLIPSAFVTCPMTIHLQPPKQRNCGYVTAMELSKVRFEKFYDDAFVSNQDREIPQIVRDHGRRCGYEGDALDKLLRIASDAEIYCDEELSTVREFFVDCFTSDDESKKWNCSFPIMIKKLFKLKSWEQYSVGSGNDLADMTMNLKCRGIAPLPKHTYTWLKFRGLSEPVAVAASRVFLRVNEARDRQEISVLNYQNVINGLRVDMAGDKMPITVKIMLQEMLDSPVTVDEVEMVRAIHHNVGDGSALVYQPDMSIVQYRRCLANEIGWPYSRLEKCDQLLMLHLKVTAVDVALAIETVFPGGYNNPPFRQLFIHILDYLYSFCNTAYDEAMTKHGFPTDIGISAHILCKLADDLHRCFDPDRKEETEKHRNKFSQCSQFKHYTGACRVIAKLFKTFPCVLPSRQARDCLPSVKRLLKQLSMNGDIAIGKSYQPTDGRDWTWVGKTVNRITELYFTKTSNGDYGSGFIPVLKVIPLPDLEIIDNKSVVKAQAELISSDISILRRNVSHALTVLNDFKLRRIRTYNLAITNGDSTFGMKTHLKSLSDHVTVALDNARDFRSITESIGSLTAFDLFLEDIDPVTVIDHDTEQLILAASRASTPESPENSLILISDSSQGSTPASRFGATRKRPRE